MASSKKTARDIAKDVTDVHRKLSQEFMAKKALSEEDLQDFADVHGIRADQLNAHLEVVKSAFEVVGFTIKKCRDSETDNHRSPVKFLHCLINNSTRFSTGQYGRFSKEENKIFLQLLKEIVNSRHRYKSRQELEHRVLKGSASRKKFLETLIKAHWLKVVRKGEQELIFVGPRTITEWPDKLLELGCKKCVECKVVCVFSEECSNDECRAEAHLYCVRPRMKCPVCKTGTYIEAEN